MSDLSRCSVHSESAPGSVCCRYQYLFSGGPVVRQGVQINVLKWWLGRGKIGAFLVSFRKKWIYSKYYHQFTLLLVIEFSAVWIDKCTQKQMNLLLLVVQLVLQVLRKKHLQLTDNSLAHFCWVIKVQIEAVEMLRLQSVMCLRWSTSLIYT